MGKVLLDQDKCIGCGACCNIAQENFTFNDEGKASLINDKITDDAIDASNTCPTRAITIDNESCNCGENCTCGDECNCTDDNCCCNSTNECSCGDDCNCTEENNCGCKN